MKTTFEEVHARPDPVTLLKINSFAGIFRDFASILTIFLLISKFPRIPLFPEHLSMTASVFGYRKNRLLIIMIGKMLAVSLSDTTLRFKVH